MPEAADTSAPPDARHVVVTVTTIRLAKDGKIQATRHHTAQGEFDQAVLRALKGRLQPWALDQVLGRIRARRPAHGEPVQYEGWFGERRQLLVAVRPADESDATTAGRKRVLKGLFLAEAAGLERPVPGGGSSRGARRCGCGLSARSLLIAHASGCERRRRACG